MPTQGPRGRDISNGGVDLYMRASSEQLFHHTPHSPLVESFFKGGTNDWQATFERRVTFSENQKDKPADRAQAGGKATVCGSRLLWGKFHKVRGCDKGLRLPRRTVNLDRSSNLQWLKEGALPRDTLLGTRAVSEEEGS